jgi:hypothetical protein
MRRTDQVIVRLAPSEKAQLRALAQAAHLTISDYCRDRLLRTDADLVAEVGKLRAIANRAAIQAQAADRRAMQAIAIAGRGDA